jgi:2-amino-4-hydroxy-6-hydroxymethyldihydropteridine diphosphokinase
MQRHAIHCDAMEHTSYLSLGSNLGDRVSHLRTALHHLEGCGHVSAVSNFYATEPVENTAQPEFINCAACLVTALEPLPLLQKILSIERTMGRDREKDTQAKGPRIIDIDILLFDDILLDTPELHLPHPAMHLRRFVLAPMAEIAAEICHPTLKQNMEEMLIALGDAGGSAKIFHKE